VFAKVAEERSYSGVARPVGLSMATVSRAVSRLEKRLAGRLLNRTSRRLAFADFDTARRELFMWSAPRRSSTSETGPPPSASTITLTVQIRTSHPMRHGQEAVRTGGCSTIS
jgi:DNA-binding transcriptional LysR family regulator